MSGGALSVTHVDTQKRALERCRENHRLNDQRIDDRDLMRVNVYQHFRKAAARRRRYGGIIVDPPPLKELKVAKSDRTPGGRGVLSLVPTLSAMLDSRAWMLCFFHHDSRSWDELESEVLALAERPVEPIWRASSGADFPEEDETRALRLSAFQALE